MIVTVHMSERQIGVNMELREKIKALHIEKKKSFRLILGIEIFLIVLGVIGLFGKSAVYDFGLESMHANFGIYDEEAGGYAVQEKDGQRGNLVDFCDISLPRGVYAVSLRYQTDTDMKNICTVTDGTVGYRTLRTNGEHLYAGLNSTDFIMWLTADAEGLIVHAEYGGEGSLVVTGLTISETNALNRIFLFWVVVLSLLLNSCLLYREYDRIYGIPVKDKTVTFGLAVIILFASMPLMWDYMASGGDLGYHLMRIEGIKDSLLNGMFPARNAPEWQQGYGYASAIFYGETLLYIAAFFRLIGFTVVTSYRMFFFVMTAAQVLIAYFCFKRMFGEKYIGLLCSMLYTLSVYRIYKTYCCGSFGESFGVLFLPFIAYGFWRVFTQDIREKDYRRSWVPLTIGFCGLIQSHLLTCEMVGFFTIVLCIVEMKKVFRKETFLVLAKTVIYSCLISAWFLVPFLDYMLTGNFVIQNVSARTIQNRGLYPAHLFFTFSRTGQGSDFEGSGMYQSDPINLGFALTVVFLLWLGLCFFQKTRGMKKEDHRLGWIAAAFAMSAMLLSLSAFPWDTVHGWNGILRTLVSSLQFPNRWLSIANISLVVLAGVIAKWVLLQNDTRGLFVYFAGMTVLVLCSNVYLLTDLNYHADVVRVYNSEGMGTGYISGAEYLPYGADATKFSHRDPLTEDGLVLESYEKKGLTIDFDCTNTGDSEALVRMPLLYYKGYVTYDVSTRETFETFADEDFFVTTVVPAGYSGHLRTCFRSPWYWRAAEAVSVLFLAGLLLEAHIMKRRKRVCGK